MQCKNLLDILLKNRKGRKGITFINDSKIQHFVSYEEIFVSAEAVLYHLQARGLKPGYELVFQISDNLDFITVFWACLLGKIIPAAVTTGANPETLLKLFNTWKLLSNPYLITFKSHLEIMETFAGDRELRGIFGHIKNRTIDIEEVKDKAGKGLIYIPRESDTAFIQFSSGSTGEPKGVVLTHRNLLVNITAIIEGLKSPGTDKCFSWMPLTHDMGLIGFHLVPLAANWDHVLMAAQLFVRYPELWLQKVFQTRSTLIVSPNFGYKYVLEHFTPGKYEDLDLSCVRLVFNGAEPICAKVCGEFLDRFSPYGLIRRAMFPVYGLAEASLAVTFSEPEKEPVFDYFTRDTLTIGKKASESDSSADAAALTEVGEPINHCYLKIVDGDGNRCGDKIIGHILVKGSNVTPGYYNNPETTSDNFAGDGWLRTGDLGFLRNHRLYITGRVKEVLFINGINYYPSDIERVAAELPGITFEKIAVCGVYHSQLQRDEIICFVVFKREIRRFLPLINALKDHILRIVGIEVDKVIPAPMIPKTTSRKIQRYLLKNNYLEGKYDEVLEEIDRLQRTQFPSKPPLNPAAMRELVGQTLREVLGKSSVGEDENFFDLGGDSIRAVQVKIKLQKTLGKEIDDAAIFKYPTIHTLADFLSSSETEVELSVGPGEHSHRYSHDRKIKNYLMPAKEPGISRGQSKLEVAVIGMAGRFPGAKNCTEFWDNLKNGIESISFFSDEELEESGIPPELSSNPQYVKAKGIIENVEYFDASFFDYSPREAKTMDPQVRILHECAWEALENGGCDPDTYQGLIGLYAGATPHIAWNSISSPSPQEPEPPSIQLTNVLLYDKDFMTTRIAYKLNLKGTTFNVFTACSTSLVAIHTAYNSILNGECDMALAGGVSISFPIKTGYLYEEGMIQSADGHHRCFDEKAIGSVFGDGAGVVLLKRLEDAAADKDTIYAIIKGSALNNDGNRKLGYLAPSVEGQTEVIRRAQQMARVEPESIGYIETHGSATPLGDVVEIEALTQVFNKVNTGKKQWCPMGSVKANVGHPNIAAGITGFIKTVLVLKHRLIPPHINFENPNSRIDFENTPFYVNTRLKEWKSKGYPFRAGVCSFGIGGTNAYVILEEPPAMEPLPETRNRKLLMLSAKTPISLDQAGKNLLNFLKENPTVNLSDAAYTLQVGRKHFQFREMLVCSNRDEAVEILSSREPGKISRFDSKGERPDVIFLFPGLGSQYVNMGMGLYRDERVFREQMDRFFSIYCSITGDDIREILYPAAPPGGSTANTEREDLQQPGISQPVIFMFEYSLAKLLMSWGIIPSEMLGYSFGEYTAACISGVISPEDALGLIILRGRLMARLPKGAMTSVPLPFNQLEPIMDSRLSIAVDNGPSCIVGGAGEAIDEFEQAMKGKGYLCIRVNVPHAAHSPEMTPILAEFAEAVRKIELKDPQIPYISNVTGKRAIAAQVKSHQYWVTHLAETVRFGPGLNRLLKQPGTVFVEMGPGRDLSVLAKVQKEYTSSNRFVNLVRHWKEQWDDNHYLLNRLGLLWLYGVEIDWRKFYANEKRYRIPLPSYPFEGRYYWPDGNPSRVTGIQNVGKPELKKQKNVSDWFYIPVWKQSAPVIPGNRKSTGKIHWMVAVGECSFAKRLLERLLVEERDVITVKAGHEFVKESDSVYTIRPGKREDYKTLFNHLHDGAGLPDRIVFLWGVDREECNPRQLEPGDFEKAQEKIFYSLVYMVQALSGIEGGKPTRIIVVNNGLHQVTGKEILAPHKATVLGAVTCINHEFKEISCQSVDIALPGEGSPDEEELVGQLLAEFRWESREMVTAYRGPYRWERRFDKVKWEGDGIDTPSCQLRKKGTYLIVGGLGEIGFILAKELTVQLGAKLILTGRTIHTDEKQEKLRELENSGAEVLVFEADAANRQQMEEVVRVSEERLGPIKGVIHAAGILGDEMFRTVNELDKEHCRKHFEAKVHGVLNLAAIFQGRDLDFCLLMSSVASTLGGMGMTAYSAANLFMDAYALSKKRDNGVHWLSAGWDRWQSNGTNRQSDFINGVMGDLLITEEEGTRAFHGILSPGIGNLIIISTGHFETRVNQWAKIKKRKERKIPGDSSARAPLSSWSRVGFLTAYAEPQNQVEQIITDLMKNYFGFEQIGIDDNFFDLGATSLDLVQLNSKLNAVWSQKIPLVKLLTYTSIRTLAHYIMEEVISNRPLNKEIDRSDVFKRGQRNIEEKLKIRRNKT